MFGFDSWDGLPEEWLTGAADCKHPAGTFACEPPKDLQRGVKLVRGLFSETIPGWLAANSGPVQFLHIDCDLYSGARDVLFGMNDRLMPGSVIVFDELVDWSGDWYPNWQQGEWKALTEWMAECRREIEPIGRTAHQQAAFIVKD